MKLNRKKLTNILNFTKNIISKNITLPILEYIYFEIKDNILTGIVTNIDTSIKIKIDDVKEDDKIFLVLHGTLHKLLKSLTDEYINFNIIKTTLVITDEEGKYKIPIYQNHEEFPAIPEKKENINKIKFDFLLLKEQLSIMSTFTNAKEKYDDLRPVLSCGYIDINAKGINYVATNAHKLYKNVFDNDKNQKEISILISPIMMNIITKLKKLEDITLEIDNDNTFIEFHSTSMVFKNIVYSYPKYNNVIPDNYTKKFLINKSSLLESVKKLKVLSNQANQTIIFNIKKNQLTITTEDLDFNNEGTITKDIVYDNDDIKIGLNINFLETALISFDDDIEISFDSNKKAMLFKKENKLALLMPIMLNN